MKLEEITKDKTEPDGTYASVHFNEDTINALNEYIKKNNIPNPAPVGKLHSTLLYSRNYLPEYKPQGKLSPEWEGKFKQFSIFSSNPENDRKGSILVMEYSCSEQSKRFDELMDAHDATYDFDEYKPHITLSYDLGDFDHEKLPKFEKPLKIVEEKGEDLNLNWEGENRRKK